MEIYLLHGANESKLCETNALDYTFINDWKTGQVSEYCGKKFLGDCIGKPIQDNFKVTLRLSNPVAHFFRIHDELCLKWIKHEIKGQPFQESISSGWSSETEGANKIKTNFV